jgi:hypothetical protein
MKNNSTALAQIEAAKTAILEAERELDRLMRETPTAVPEKTTITEVVHNAFQQVRRAREHLVALEKLAGAKDE